MTLGSIRGSIYCIKFLISVSIYFVLYFILLVCNILLLCICNYCISYCYCIHFRSLYYAICFYRTKTNFCCGYKNLFIVPPSLLSLFVRIVIIVDMPFQPLFSNSMAYCCNVVEETCFEAMFKYNNLINDKLHNVRLFHIAANIQVFIL